MRVIAGKLGRRRLHAPAGLTTRPTADRLRQALFDILGPTVGEGFFVDVYAGSGAVGIEAYSRDARPVVWIESRAIAVRTLRANLAQLEIRQDAVVLQRPALAALRGLSRLPEMRTRGGCGCLYLDPPYSAAEELARALATLGEDAGGLGPGSRVVAECRRGTALPEESGRLRLERVHSQGDSQLNFYRITASRR